MRLLLDTCTFLWLATNAPQLSRRARELFADPANEVYLSAVSAWEIAIKYTLGRLRLPDPPAVYLPDRRRKMGIEELPLEEAAALHLSRLPRLDPDPFDRMLVSQSIVHAMTILTPDPQISRYPAPVIW